MQNAEAICTRDERDLASWCEREDYSFVEDYYISYIQIGLHFIQAVSEKGMILFEKTSRIKEKFFREKIRV